MALDADKIKVEIKKGGNGLQKEIEKYLDGFQLTIKSAKENPDGSIEKVDQKLYPFNVELTKKQTGTDPRTMKFDKNVGEGSDEKNGDANRSKYTGLEGIVESIVEKTVDSLVDTLVDKILNDLVIYIPKGQVIVAVSGGSGSAAVGTPNPSDLVIKQE